MTLSESPAKKLTVLIADDVQETRRNTRLMFASLHNVEVVAIASNGRQAVEMTRQHRPNIVVMDINMPQMDGIEAVRNLRADSEISHIPVFISTGEGNAKKNFTKEQMTEVQGFVEKPYQIEKILGQIKNILKE